MRLINAENEIKSFNLKLENVDLALKGYSTLNGLDTSCHDL